MGFFSTDVGAATNAGLRDDAETQALVQARNNRRAAEIAAETEKANRMRVPVGTPAGVARPATTQVAAPSIDNAKYFEDLYKDSAGAYATEGAAPGTYKPTAGVSTPSRPVDPSQSPAEQVVSGVINTAGDRLAMKGASERLRVGSATFPGTNMVSRGLAWLFEASASPNRAMRQRAINAQNWYDDNRKTYMSSDADKAEMDKDPIGFAERKMQGSPTVLGKATGTPKPTKLGKAKGSATTFDQAIPRLLGREGKDTDDPDGGGLTRFGISQDNHPNVDVKSLTKDQAIAIYRAKYWDAIGADRLPDSIREMAFDSAVNQGVGFTNKALDISGGDPARFLQMRENQYKLVAENPKKAKYLNGWLNRLDTFYDTLGIPPALPPATKVNSNPLPPEARKEVAAIKKEIAGVNTGKASVIRDITTKQRPAEPNLPARAFSSPEVLNKELSNAMVQRNNMLRLANIYRSAGDGVNYINTIAKADLLTAGAEHLAQQKAVNLFEKNNDGRMLAATWNAISGKDYQLVPRSDGLWDIMVGGQAYAKGIKSERIVSAQRSMMSSEWVTSVNAAATAGNMKKLEAGWDWKKAIDVQMLKNASAELLEQMKVRGRLVKDAVSGVWQIDGNKITHLQMEEIESKLTGETVNSMTKTTSALPGNANSQALASAAQMEDPYLASFRK